MPIKVLVVDDSSFFRSRIVEILQQYSSIEVVGTAVNGQEALDKTLSLQPNVITMDYEMPVMNGIAAVESIMRQRPTPILMLSSLTHEGARVTLDALDAGAVDFMPKTFESMSPSESDTIATLVDKVVTLGTAQQTRTTATRIATTAPTKRVASPAKKTAGTFCPKIIVIGASTGGPVALQAIIQVLPANFPFPILITQHMPATFTQAFASRLNDMSRLSVKEAESGDKIQPGRVLIAPGGQQMTVAGSLHNATVSIVGHDDRLAYKPSVDVTFGSVAKLYEGSALAIVLTGMGADGKEGAKLLKSKQSKIWSQDEKSCVVYGMPRAVAEENLVDEVIKLSQFSSRLIALSQ